ncbi:hypothetical protein EG329_004785 [Mollisiaceae sp. DMI_Dod_QoI]|nr:hypothetical protein EG329_004785 [Helotiales sp. DMI_Dod_QoI]
MHLSTTALIAIVAYTSSAAAYPQAHQPYKRQEVSNTTTSATSSPDVTVTPSVTQDTSTLTAVLSSSSTTLAVVTASATGQPIAVQGGTYAAAGCYIDVANTGYPLIGAARVAVQSTTQQCLDTCAQSTLGGPYAFAGVEGTQCFCSNNFLATAPQSPGSCGTSSKKRDTGKRQVGTSITIYVVRKLQQNSTGSTTSGTDSSSTASTTLTGASSSSTGSSTSGTDSSSTASSTLSGTSSIITASATLSSTASSVSTTQSSTTTTAAPSPTRIVVAGDTLASIADAAGVSLAALEALNPQITDPNFIFPGQVINIPSSGTTVPTNPGTPNVPTSTATYRVQAGNTLTTIAAQFGVSLATLEAANPQITNPDLIFPGQVIRIPSTNVFTYSVASGNTLGGIAVTFGISLAALEAANPQITNPNLIFPGQVINIP